MLAGRRILLVEDDAIMGASLAQRLELEGAVVRWVKQVVLAIPEIRVARAPVDAVVCDIKLPDGTGEEIFERVSATMTPPPFLFITGQGAIDQAVRLMHAGAADYITKPFEMPVFLERLTLLMRPQGGLASPPMLGVSQMARRLSEDVIKAAHADDNVVIVGGPGTGKGAIARLIHERSDRRSAPLIDVNIARDPDLTEALFGKEGALERTGDGVLVLRAIERMHPSLQAAERRQIIAALDRTGGQMIEAARLLKISRTTLWERMQKFGL